MKLNEIKDQLPSYNIWEAFPGTLEDLQLAEHCAKLYLTYCHNLINLEGCPRIIENVFAISECASLKTLEGCCERVGGNMVVVDNHRLVSLKGIEHCVIKGDFYCDGNSKLIKLDQVPQRVEGKFILRNIPIKDVKAIGSMEYCRCIEFDIKPIRWGLYDMLSVKGLEEVTVHDSKKATKIINRHLPLHGSDGVLKLKKDMEEHGIWTGVTFTLI